MLQRNSGTRRRSHGVPVAQRAPERLRQPRSVTVVGAATVQTPPPRQPELLVAVRSKSGLQGVPGLLPPTQDPTVAWQAPSGLMSATLFDRFTPLPPPAA